MELLVPTKTIRREPRSKNLEQHRSTDQTLNNSEFDQVPVFITPPDLSIDYPIKEYKWHLKISVEAQLVYSEIEKLTQEFKLQTEIESKLTTCFENVCQIKKIMSYHRNNQIVHLWYLDHHKNGLSIENILEFDIINKERAIDFELKFDENWREVIPLLEKVERLTIDYRASL